MIKRIFLIFMLVILLFILSDTVLKATNSMDLYSRNYYINNTYHHTGAKNIVTGIYLDYRLFDSIFEAGILIVVVTGIIFISKKDDEIL